MVTFTEEALAALVTFTEEVLNGKFHFCAVDALNTLGILLFQIKLQLLKYTRTRRLVSKNGFTVTLSNNGNICAKNDNECTEGKSIYRVVFETEVTELIFVICLDDKLRVIFLTRIFCYLHLESISKVRNKNHRIIQTWDAQLKYLLLSLTKIREGLSMYTYICSFRKYIFQYQGPLTFAHVSKMILLIFCKKSGFFGNIVRAVFFNFLVLFSVFVR